MNCAHNTLLAGKALIAASVFAAAVVGMNRAQKRGDEPECQRDGRDNNGGGSFHAASPESSDRRDVA